MVSGAVADHTFIPESYVTPLPHTALQNAARPMHSIGVIGAVRRVQCRDSDCEDAAGFRARCWREYMVS